MERPFNQILHDNLINKGYKYTQRTHCDRYELNESIVLLYMNGYIVMIEGDDVAPPKAYADLAKDISSDRR